MRAVQNVTLNASVKDASWIGCSMLICSSLPFSLWWFSLPATLKGWVDRVFVMVAVFAGNTDCSAYGALAGERAMLRVSRQAGPVSLFQPGGAFGSVNDFLFHIHRGRRRVRLGFQVLEPVVTYGPAHMTDLERTAALEAVRESVALIAADSQTTVH